MFRMKRREFITLLGGAAMAWPLAARAQQVERVRRVGVLSNLAADDPEAQARNTAFLQALAQLGWTNGQNVRIDLRWASGDPGRFHKYADELLALAPDVVLGAATPSIVALQRATRTVPIVFVGVGDPVAAGFVESLARPGGNTTGFTPYEYGIAAKWLELLKEIAPNTTRAAVIREPSVSGIGQFAAMQGVAPSLGVELSPIDPRDAGAIERAVDSFARKPNGALIVTGSPLTGVHRNLIFALAARHRLPAIYPFRYYVKGGGLMSYGADLIDEYRRAAGYVDRILKGEKPADLPVQAPTKYGLAINLKTARALGLTVPEMLLARANEVIE